jgi:hypothetical protein
MTQQQLLLTVSVLRCGLVRDVNLEPEGQEVPHSMHTTL